MRDGSDSKSNLGQETRLHTHTGHVTKTGASNKDFALVLNARQGVRKRFGGGGGEGGGNIAVVFRVVTLENEEGGGGEGG